MVLEDWSNLTTGREETRSKITKRAQISRLPHCNRSACLLHQSKSPLHSSSWVCFQPVFAFLSDHTDAQKTYNTPELVLHASTAQLIREQEISALSPMPIFIAIYYSLKTLTRFPRANPWRTRSPSSTKLHNLIVISAPALTKK